MTAIQVVPELRNIPPDYILLIPKENAVPEIQASADKEELDELKGLKVDGMYIYKLVGRKS